MCHVAAQFVEGGGGDGWRQRSTRAPSERKENGIGVDEEMEEDRRRDRKRHRKSSGAERERGKKRIGRQNESDGQE